MSIINKIFGDPNKKYLKKIEQVIEKINSFEPVFEKLSDLELKNKTAELKQKLTSKNSGEQISANSEADKNSGEQISANSETDKNSGEQISANYSGVGTEGDLDGLLPEAFALVREASKRTLNQRHFDVQLIGGIALHQGKIAEMRTGEGKTLAATLPTYLNALQGKGVHVITVNDYLAKRDAVWMGQIYDFLGLTVGCIGHDQSYIYDPSYVGDTEKKDQESERDELRDTIGAFKVVESYLRPVSRKEAYSADITYGTNNEFGFDYLRDNMAYDLNQQVQRGFNYAIVDEIDSILIDEARTPLIISAPDMESSRLYQDFASIIPQLNAEEDYQIDEKMKAVTLTEQGIAKVEKILGLENIYEKGIKYLRYLEQALRAQAIVPSMGRPFFAKDYQYVVKDGQVIIIDEFTGRLMPGRRWSGGLHQAVEAKEGVKVNPESLTLASITFQNYFRMYDKLAGMTGTAVTSAEEFDKVYKLEVIVVPTNKPTIREDFSDRVYKSLNGKFRAVAKEVKERHQKGQPVLIGTTSIEKNEHLSKLLEIEGIDHQVLNAKHHQKEGQIIAQAGRLNSVTVATNMAGRGVDIVLGGNPPNPEEAQKVKELGGLHVIGTERHEARRIDNQLQGRTGRQGDPGSSQFFISLEDDLMRVFASDKIKSLMTTLNIPEDQPIEAKMISGAIESAQGKIEGMNFDVRKHVLEYDDVMNKHREVFYKKRKEILEKFKKSELNEYLLKLIQSQGFSKEDYLKKEAEVGSEKMRQVEKVIALRVLDTLWLEHLENMDYLRDSVKLRAYGQKDPLVEYKSEGHKMFQEFLTKMEKSIAETLLNPELIQKTEQPEPVAKPAFSEKTGRNDPCPCGSGKKYKKCHG